MDKYPTMPTFGRGRSRGGRLEAPLPLTHTTLIYGRGYRAGMIDGIRMHKGQSPIRKELKELEDLYQQVLQQSTNGKHKDDYLESI